MIFDEITNEIMTTISPYIGSVKHLSITPPCHPHIVVGVCDVTGDPYLM